jgi:hypothetical protein
MQRTWALPPQSMAEPTDYLPIPATSAMPHALKLTFSEPQFLQPPRNVIRVIRSRKSCGATLLDVVLSLWP